MVSTGVSKTLGPVSSTGIVAIVLAVILTGCAKKEEYETIRVCNGPFMRRDKEMVVKRKSDGKHFYVRFNGQMIPLEDGYRMKDVCR